MTTEQAQALTQNYSGATPASKLPPVDEVCRILARVRNRINVDAAATSRQEVGR